MLKKTMTAMLAVAATGMALTLPLPAQAADQVRIGQATPALSFMPLYAARALNSFDKTGASLRWAAISGGDPSALAALDAGDIDFAAVGADTALNAIAKGQPFELVYTLMSRVTLEMVVSNAFLKRTGVSPSTPLKKRIAALRNGTFGVTAIGGAQDRMLRWLAKQGGLDPRKDLKIAQVGPPPALQAALENHRIDGFILSPPQGYVAHHRKYGQVLVKLGSEIPALQKVPYLVLVAKKPLSAKTKRLAVEAARGLQAASAAAVSDPNAVAKKIHANFFKKASQEALDEAVSTMKAGVADHGELTADGIKRLVALAEQSGMHAPKDTAEGTFWTNAYVAAAMKKQ